ncbi:MAG: hypothetical protein LBD97_08120, partial [Bifidobacteriaceae bacterium]|nr:hypothetical protein [Bifidobacteriaceae bacterium]
ILAAVWIVSANRSGDAPGTAPSGASGSTATGATDPSQTDPAQSDPAQSDPASGGSTASGAGNSSQTEEELVAVESFIMCLAGVGVLAAIVERRLREAWKPLTFADEELPAPTGPSKPARRSLVTGNQVVPSPWQMTPQNRTQTPVNTRSFGWRRRGRFRPVVAPRRARCRRGRTAHGACLRSHQA